MPTLEEVLKSLPAGKQFFIEIKCGTEILPALSRVLKRASKERPELASQLTIICFNAKVIAACRERFPEIPANLLKSYGKEKGSEGWRPDPDSVFAQLADCNASALGTQANSEVITPAFVHRLRDAKLGFHCWTVNEPELARHFAELGVDSITTDYPAKIRAALEAGAAVP